MSSIYIRVFPLLLALTAHAQLKTNQQAFNLEVEPLAFDQYCFQYKYDARHRKIAEKKPGADWTWFIYDARDRLVLTQDGNQRQRSEWSFTKYDAFNRIVLTGACADPLRLDRLQMQDSVNRFYQLASAENWFEQHGNDVHDYTNRSFPRILGENEYLTVTYYDNYSFKGSRAQREQLNPKWSKNVIGQVTGSKVKNLENDEWYSTTNYYDDYYRLLQSETNNHKGGADIITNDYDFAGRIVQTKTIHHVSNQPAQTITRRYTYDHAGRLLETWHKFNNHEFVLLSSNEYNELGQLTKKNLFRTPSQEQYAQQIDYRYTIRSWLSQINNVSQPGTDLFSAGLEYETLSPSGRPSNYNGNISEMTWRTAGGPRQSYHYSYDTLSRFKSAGYTEHDNPSHNDRYSEILEYDLHGNIINLKRNGSAAQNSYGPMDDLRYVYSGNHLIRLDDALESHPHGSGFNETSQENKEYEYDHNGNMIADFNKDSLTITYTILNLPNLVTNKNGDSLLVTYDAGGRKLREEVRGRVDRVREYMGDFMYENDTLTFVNHEEGRIVLYSDTIDYQFYLKDHLGNVRLTFSTLDQAETKTATLELERKEAERSQFLNYDDVVRVRSSLFDHTRITDTGFSVRLINGQTGLITSASTMPGDTITAEVYVKYIDHENSPSWTSVLDDFILDFTTTAPLKTAIDAAQAGVGSAFPFLQLAKPEPITGEPAIYLTYLLFDREFNFVNAGYVQATHISEEQGNDTRHERLALNIPISNPGYVFVYFSNETNESSEFITEAYFDDFKIEHLKSAIVQMDDYYPFGLTFNSALRENGVPNKFLFQGQEQVDDLGLSWIQYKWRNYQPDIGRFFNVDPLATKYVSNSPYAFSENRVTNGIELEGLEYVKRIHNEDAAGKVTTKDVVYYKMSSEELKKQGGTTAGPYNAAGYGPAGKGIQHVYVKNGEQIGESWDLPRSGFSGKIGTHGIYSGPGSITINGKGDDYDFFWQPIDVADAIAKNHDMNYSFDAPFDYQGFVEDVRTLDADLKMINQIHAVLRGKNVTDLGLQTPFRRDMSFETLLALESQQFFISALASYKSWKISQPNHGDGISINNDTDAWAYVNAAKSAPERSYRMGIVSLLRASTQK